MNTKQKPASIQSEAIAAVAQQGVERGILFFSHNLWYVVAFLFYACSCNVGY